MCVKTLTEVNGNKCMHRLTHVYIHTCVIFDHHELVVAEPFLCFKENIPETVITPAEEIPEEPEVEHTTPKRKIRKYP